MDEQPVVDDIALEIVEVEALLGEIEVERVKLARAAEELRVLLSSLRSARMPN